jgi:hypothetical protein
MGQHKGVKMGISPKVIQQLKDAGYSVRSSSTKSGKLRWFQNIGGDGKSLPAVVCSDTAFDTLDEAWNDARKDALRSGLSVV